MNELAKLLKILNWWDDLPESKKLEFASKYTYIKDQDLVDFKKYVYTMEVFIS
jgi:hypothetical protein